MAQVKLSDIAKELNVSVTLVSLVLRGKAKENRISDKISKEVLKKAKEMGYQPNQMARGLRTGKSHIIGLVVADISNPFFGKIARQLENEAWDNGYQLMFGSSDENPEKSQRLIQSFVGRSVDGLIIAPTADSKEQIERLQQQKVPFVLIDRYFNDLKTPNVVVDNFDSSYEVTKLLIQKGYRRIAAISYSSGLQHIDDRVEGYKKALEDYSQDIDPQLMRAVTPENIDTDLQGIISELLSDDVNADAIFFATNIIGIKGLKILNKMNKKIPEDIAIASFDNPESYALFPTSITCIEQPIEEIGKKALQELLKQINKGKEKTETKDYVLKTKLLVGNSI
ncbi:LacI family transcriptional regulator [Puteibacter caeruleilacunae]|nr:LacI family transcriptional regulator [Puteibacter caeruleilacunae]